MNTKDLAKTNTEKCLHNSHATRNVPFVSNEPRAKNANQLPITTDAASPRKASGGGKNSANYWLKKIFKPVNRLGSESPHYFMRLSFKGRRLGFTLGSGNLKEAASLAAGIYGDLLTLGVDGALRKHRPVEARPGAPRIATVGEWIGKAREVSQTKGATFHSYATALRKIAGDLLAVKRSKKRFGPLSGGARKYRELVDAAGLDLFSESAVQAWRLAYVRRAKNPKQESSRMTSCNSTIRMARSLFAPKVVKFIQDLRLPEPLPFASVQFYPRQGSKYFSQIDAKEILRSAHGEFAEQDQPAFLALILALSAGLRRGEIDSLCWGQVDFERQLIRVEATEAGGLKSQDSRAEVAIDENVVAILRGFHAKLKSRDTAGVFVVPGAGSEGAHRNWGRHYRADAVFKRLTDWLRSKGVQARKPLHELRKELGALVTEQHGIYAASRVMRHADVSTTARHYSDLKTRPVVNVGAWLLPENVTRMEPRDPTALEGENRREEETRQKTI
jgi:integrase